VVADQVGEYLEELEDNVFNEPSDESLQKIHKIKNDVLYLRKAVNPLKEILSKIYKEELMLIRDQNKKYFSDVFDHALHVIEVIDAYRDISTGLKDLYLSSVSTRMNKVMQVLTVIATIFIPLTFIAGIYGMNFDVMPELHWKYGYFAVWGVMLAVAVVMLVFFRRRRWL
jgi:magnesium transporter